MEKIVEATGTAGTANSVNAKEMERRMAAAVEKSYAEGNVDPEVVRAAKLKARQDYKNEMAAAEAERQAAREKAEAKKK